MDLSQATTPELLTELARRPNQGGLIGMSAFILQNPILVPKTPKIVYAEYELPDSDVRDINGNLLPTETLSTEAEARALGAELKAVKIYRSPVVPYIAGDSEREPWLLDVPYTNPTGVVTVQKRQNVQELLVARNANGMGAPGAWDFSGAAGVVTSRWHSKDVNANPWDTNNGQPIASN